MKELSLNILDIAQNSVTADASEICIDIDEDYAANRLRISVADNGRGMSADLLARVTDPFTTTRTTRKVGLGIPLFKQAAEMTGGSFSIESQPGRGTKTSAEFLLDSIDLMPLGDLPSTFSLLLASKQGINWRFSHRYRTQSGEQRNVEFDSKKTIEEIGEIDFSAAEIQTWMRDYFSQQQKFLYEGAQQ